MARHRVPTSRSTACLHLQRVPTAAVATGQQNESIFACTTAQRCHRAAQNQDHGARRRRALPRTGAPWHHAHHAPRPDHRRHAGARFVGTVLVSTLYGGWRLKTVMTSTEDAMEDDIDRKPDGNSMV